MQTTHIRRHRRQGAGGPRVMSPRIAWFGFSGFLGRIDEDRLRSRRWSAASVGASGRASSAAFYKNPDFRLKSIDLNPEPGHRRSADWPSSPGSISPPPSLFDIDVDGVDREAQGAARNRRGRVRAPASRHADGARSSPARRKAWISCPEPGLPTCAAVGGHAGGSARRRVSLSRPCSWKPRSELPMIRAARSPEHPISGRQEGRASGVRRIVVALLDSACQADPERCNGSNRCDRSTTGRWCWSPAQGTSSHLRPRRSRATDSESAHRRSTTPERKRLRTSTPSTSSPNTTSPSPCAAKPPHPRAIPVAEPSPGDPRRPPRARSRKPFSTATDPSSQSHPHGTSHKNPRRTRNRHQQDLHGRRRGEGGQRRQDPRHRRDEEPPASARARSTISPRPAPASRTRWPRRRTPAMWKSAACSSPSPAPTSRA